LGFMKNHRVAISILVLGVSLSIFAGMTEASSLSPSSRWVSWPLSTGPLRYPVIPFPNWKPGHRGIDQRAELGMAIRSPISGTVVWVGEVNGKSGVSVIDHHGFRHTLIPADSSLTVGDAVTRGDVIATVSTGSHCSLTCLHWGMRKDGRYVDPRWYAPPLIYRK
jgi:murein DD-endopeptidase MepM/ murein hydrolase activator NlpD